MNLAPYCTVREAADLAGVTQEYVRKLLAKGLLQGEKIGHAWLVRRDSVASFVRIGRGPASKPAPRAKKQSRRRRSK
jgi:excisionase family DNA binding protein